MANITLPSNPVNGQTVVIGTRLFQYDSTAGRWKSRVFQVLGDTSVTVTNEAPTITASLSEIALDTTGANVSFTYIVSDVDSSVLKVSHSVSGIANSDLATVTHHRANNTVTITAGTEEFSGGQITLTVTDGRNNATDTVDVSAEYWGFGSVNPKPDLGGDQQGTTLSMSLSSTTYSYNSEFTIEFFYRTVNHGRSNNARLTLGSQSGFSFSVNGTYSEYLEINIGPYTHNINTTYANFRWSGWNHIALVSTGTKIFMCVNGIPAAVQDTYVSSTYSFSTLQLSNTYGYRMDLNPALYSAASNFRVSNVNRYSSSITNSTETGNFNAVGYAFTPTSPLVSDSNSRFLLFGGETLGTNQGTASTSVTSGGNKWVVSTTEYPGA